MVELCTFVEFGNWSLSRTLTLPQAQCSKDFNSIKLLINILWSSFNFRFFRLSLLMFSWFTLLILWTVVFKKTCNLLFRKSSFIWNRWNRPFMLQSKNQYQLFSLFFIFKCITLLYCPGSEVWHLICGPPLSSI